MAGYLENNRDRRMRLVQHNIISSKAVLAVILLISAGAQDGRWHWGTMANPKIAAAIRQETSADAIYAGYQIVKRLAAPNAPLGGGRRPFPGFIFEDNQGRFWIAHVSGGAQVQLYDDRTGQWDTFSSKQSDSEGLHHHGDALLPSNIAHICQARDGTMWFSDSQFSQHMLAAWKDRLFLTSFNGKQWRSFPFAPTSNGSIGLVQGIDGRVWLWVMDQMSYWDQDRWSEPLRISDVLKDPAPKIPPILAGTPEAQAIQKRYLTRYEIISAMEDQEGYIWVSTHNGVLTYRPRTNEFRRFPDLRDVRARAIYEDHKGRIWFNEFDIATMYDRSDGAVTRYAPLDHIIIQPNAPNGPAIISGICQDRRGRMMFASAQGLIILNEIDKRWSFAPANLLGLDAEHVKDELESIMEDSKGRIWLPGFTGIAILAQ